MQNDILFNIGDEIRPIAGRELESNGCNNLRDRYIENRVSKLIVCNQVKVNELVRFAAFDKNGELVVQSCCLLSPQYFELVTSANNKTMSSLYTLTKEQKAGLNADDQALLELGLINPDLTVNGAGIDYMQKWLFAENRKALSKVAATEVSEIKAEIKKANAK